MSDEAVDDSLAALKLFPDWFVLSKMIKRLFNALYADENILYFNEDSNVVFNCNEWVFLTYILIILIFIIILMKLIRIQLLFSDFWLGIFNLKNAKNLKKYK